MNNETENDVINFNIFNSIAFLQKCLPKTVEWKRLDENRFN